MITAVGSKATSTIVSPDLEGFTAAVVFSKFCADTFNPYPTLHSTS